MSKITMNLFNAEYEILPEICESLRWTASYDPEDKESDVFWQDSPLLADELTLLKPFQRINHFPGMYAVARKDQLAKHLKLMKKRFPEEYSFFPSTWVLPKEINDFKNHLNGKRKRTFIVKPEALSQGQGIFLIRRLDEVPEHCVIQRYIQRPLLIDGYKFDLRVYLLLTGCDPMRLFIHKEGLVRLATNKYSHPSSANLTDLYMHLTNYAINKNNPDFTYSSKGRSEFVGHKRSLKKLMEYLHGEGHDSVDLWGKICDLAVKVMCMTQPLLSHLYRSSQANDPENKMCFQILGLDILLDHKLVPYVLEVNHTPSFNTDTPLDKQVKTAIITDALRILGLSKNNRSKYYHNFHTHIVNRASKGIKEMREYRSQLREKSLKQREFIESKHKGDYELIYPSQDTKYDLFIEAAKGRWLGHSHSKSLPKEPEEPPKPPRKKQTPKLTFSRLTIPSSIQRSESTRKSSLSANPKLPSIRPPGNFVQPRLFTFDESRFTMKENF